MTSKTDIKPTTKIRIMDLVRAAGVDISDWENSPLGASNPRYCYEWAFVQPGKVVVLTLWYSSIKEFKGSLSYCPSSPNWNTAYVSAGIKAVFERRWRKLVNAVRDAYLQKLPIRAVISDGLQVRPPGTSQVQRRSLDSAPWWVAEFNDRTGQYTLLRDSRPRVIDQFAIDKAKETERRDIMQRRIIRDPDVRRRVLAVSDGKCEWCGQPGFKMQNDDVYLETHHIVPLSENGEDREENIAVLCPNHHREAHHGKNRTQMRKKLQRLRAKWL